MWIILLSFLFLPLLCLHASQGCVKDKRVNPGEMMGGSMPGMDVFFVNLDQSLDRRKQMLAQLHYFRLIAPDKAHLARVRAITPANFIIPDYIATPFHCRRLTSDSIDNYTRHAPHPEQDPYMLVTSHCGRPRNTKKDMAVTLSHLFAIKAATDNLQSDQTKYALILEDDMEFAYDIDFQALIDSAPKEWGILQLITSNSYDINQLWQQYTSKVTHPSLS
jgi:GR25 family glycosyltransferase involved in LPS biosynthesis